MFIFRLNDGNYIHTKYEYKNEAESLLAAVKVTEEEYYDSESYLAKPESLGAVVFDDEDLLFVLMMSVVKFGQHGDIIPVYKINDN